MAGGENYTPGFSFTDYQTSNPSLPLPGNELDAELLNISNQFNDLVQDVSLIQRADGALNNGIVTAESLAPGLNLGINSFAPWLTGTQYAQQAGVIINNAIYVCIVAHTSTVFANDLAAGNWQLIINFNQFAPSPLTIPLTFRNAFVNGLPKIAQRGTSFANIQNAVTQTIDMWTAWKGANTAGMNVSIVAGAATADGTVYDNLIRVQRTAANADTSLCTLANLIPSADMARFAGQTVTLSFVARAGANFSSFNGGPNPQFVTGTGSDEGSASLKAGTWTGESLPFSLTQPLTTALTRYQYTFTLNAGVTEGAFQIANFPTGTAGANDYFDIGGLQLEIGAAATPFENMSFEETLSRCLPFYQKSFDYGVLPAQGTGADGPVEVVSNATSVFGCSVEFTTPMYKTPAVTLYSPASANNKWYDSTGVADIASSVSRTGTKRFSVISTANGTAGHENIIHWSAEGGL